MTNVSAENKALKTRKLIVQMVSGGLVGGIGSYAAMSLIDPKTLNVDQVIVGGIGLIYLLMGLFVGFGLLAPKLGSKILNVEDVEEIHEQRRMLTGSSIVMATIGAALAALALAAPGATVSPLAGFGGIAAALMVSVAITARDWKYYDEMMWQLSRDAGNLAFCGIGTILMLWGSAAAVGLAAAPTPLALVALVAGGMLLAIFVSATRAGLMMPR